MKKYLLLILCFLFAIVLSSCESTSKDYEDENESTSASEVLPETEAFYQSTENTETITVNGVVYRNKFQGDLILKNPQYGSEPVYEDESGRFFKLEGTDYDLIYNVSSPVIGAPESVYCRDDQWQELYRYYSNTENFVSQCVVNQKGGEFKLLTVDKIDFEKLNKLVDFCEENSYDPFAFADEKNTRRVSTSSLGNTEYRFGVTSNDGLFSYGATSFYVLEDKLVLEHYQIASQGKTLVADVPEELSEYFISIINNLNY